MERIGIPIPGWPDYTIDEQLTVRSYRRGVCKVMKIVSSNRLNVVTVRRTLNGHIQKCTSRPERLLYCAQNGIDPISLCGSDFCYSGGQMVSRDELNDKICKLNHARSYVPWTEGSAQQVYDRSIKFLHLQRIAQLTGDTGLLLNALNDWRPVIQYHFRRLNKLGKIDDDVRGDAISEAITGHCERVVKGRQIFPDLIAKITNGALEYCKRHKRLVSIYVKRDNYFFDKTH